MRRFALSVHNLRVGNLLLCQKTKNKTVLLRERKRHTDCHLSSTPCAVLSWRGRGTPGGSPLAGVPPILTWLGVPQVGPLWLGYPLPCPDLARVVPWAGTPWLEYPPVLTWLGTPCPDLARGYPRWVFPGWGTLPLSDLARGYSRQVPPGWGTPPSWPDWGVPQADAPWLGYPPPSWPGWGNPPSDLAGVPPTPHLDLAGVLPPPQVWIDRRTDKCQSITFPSYYVRGR